MSPDPRLTGACAAALVNPESAGMSPNSNPSPPSQPPRTLPAPLDGRRRALGFLTLALIAVLFLAGKLKGGFPDASEIDPALLNEPLQQATEREPFEMVHEGHTIRVRPVAEYELWGLVVSHNNIQSVADIYHDSSSLDTKDLCVVWGSNLTSGELGKVSFESGPWTCYYSYPEGVRFAGSEMSNSHLITDQESLRADLDAIRVGDQIRVKGALVNYQLDDWRDYWRRSSTVRNDSGNGACEVLFFEEIEVLVPGTPLWYTAFNGALFLLTLVPLAFMHSIWIDSKRLAEAARRKPAFEGAAPEIWPEKVEG